MRKIKWFLGIIFVIGIFVWGVQALQTVMTPAIGVLEIEGSIHDSVGYLKGIKALEENDQIKAILVRIDSPGGKVGPSQEIYGSLLKIKGKKPLVVSMGSVSASGGYYIACAADTIFALPGTLTGSIGVILEFLDISEGLEKIGVKSERVVSGDMKESGSPFKTLTDREREYFLRLVEDVHEQFVEAVALSRELPVETVQEFADGRVFTGRQAMELGLVDRLGGLEDAITEVKEKAGIVGKVRFIRPEISTGILETIRKALGVLTPREFGATARVSGRLIRLEYSID